jgi:glyoxylase-like metal-dependent hydrolase (beta-lactamase superfamily II)
MALRLKLSKLPIVVLNSHTHDDHVENNWQFDAAYTMDTEFTHHNAKGSKDVAQAEIAPGEICGSLPAGFDHAAYRTRPWRESIGLHESARIDLGGRILGVIATRGHTPDSIFLFDRANRLLFTGDTYDPGTVWLYRPETDLSVYGSPVQRIAALRPEVKLVLGAHKVPVARQIFWTTLWPRSRKCSPDRCNQNRRVGKVTDQVGDISFLMRPPSDAR